MRAIPNISMTCVWQSLRRNGSSLCHSEHLSDRDTYHTFDRPQEHVLVRLSTPRDIFTSYPEASCCVVPVP